ncbi:MAG: tetratricopeptide repeat protein [Terriglobales bacterium]
MRKVVSIFVLLLFAAAAMALPPELKTASDLLNSGHADDAIRVLNTHLKSSPHDADAFNLLARTYFAMHRWDRAIAAGEKAVELDPDNSSYHMWLGRMYGEKADHSNFVTAARLVNKVRSEFERAVELDASNLDARTDLAEFYLEAPGFMGGGKDKALRQASLMKRENAAVAHWVYARLYDKEGLDAEAESEYREAIQASGGDARYWLNLASFYSSRQRYPEMEKVVTTAMRSERHKPVNLFDAASLLLSAGRDFVGATQLLHKYLAGLPTEEAPAFQAHYVLGQIHEKQGDKAAAAVEYRAALALAKDFDEARTALARVEQ